MPALSWGIVLGALSFTGVPAILLILVT